MRHPSLVEWDRKMKMMFDEIDDYLEDSYGHLYTLRPNRPSRGKTSSREMDGLFNVGADFTPGYGSRTGRGYIVQVRISTPEHVLEEVRIAIENDVKKLTFKKLKKYFPGRNLKLEQDGSLLKIVGDMNLGDSIVE